MKSKIRITALLLAILFSLSSVSENVLAAEENTTPSQPEQVVAQENTTPVATENTTLETGETPTPSMETKTQEVNLLIDYAVVASPKVVAGEKQSIVVGFNQKAELLTGLRARIINSETGAILESKVSKTIDKAALFEFSDGLVRGAYTLDRVIYTVNGKEIEIAINDTGMNVTFGVEKDVETKPDAVVEDESNITPEILEVGGNSTTARYKSNGAFTVVIDPGHGGTDSGTKAYYDGNWYYERDLVMKISNYCKEYLQNNTNYTIYMTREDNSGYRTLEGRLAYAESVGADFLISIHINAGGGTGAEVYIPSTNYNASLNFNGKIVGGEIMSYLTQLGVVNRGSEKIRMCTDNSRYPDGSLTDYYGIIRHGKLRGITSIIVEHCFLDREEDFRNHLSTEAQLKALGEADAKGVINALPQFTGSYSLVFDAEYYANMNPDVKAAYGYDRGQLLNHFVKYGMSEGRIGCDSFNVNSYRLQYPDLREAYGSDLKAYYMHYIKYGYMEGRQGTGCTRLVGATTKYNGVDYSAVYDYEYYVANNGDVYSYYNGDEKKIIAHFVYYGMSEGRRAKESFDVTSYRNAYRDLRQAYGLNLKSYYMHYIKWGQREGRTAVGCTRLSDGETVYNGVDYSAVYDYDYYLALNGDVNNAFGGDENAVLAHFVNYGMSEGRIAKESFNVYSYRNTYLDLRKAYGKDLKAYYMHYIKWGRNEGRVTTGQTNLIDPRTDYNGIDYADVYDLDYYLSMNGDVYAAYGRDEDAVLAHFVRYGMSEGRIAKASFNVSAYKNRYGDLQTAYGNNLAAYYMHYINYGKREGRLTA